MRTLITADSHIVAPPWLRDELPEKLRRHVPGRFDFEERDDGNYVVPRNRDGRGVTMMMGSGGDATPIKVEGDADVANIISFGHWTGATARWDPAGRLEDLARDGVVAAVLIGDPEFKISEEPDAISAQIAYCQVLNDWLYEHYKGHLGVFAPGISLPWLDVAASVKELERNAARGMRPGLLPDGIYTHLYWAPDWEPLWEAASGLRVPLTMHIGGINTPEWAQYATRPRWPGEIFEHFYSGSCDQGRTLMSLALSGMLAKYPDLHVVMTEGYAFWLAGVMQFTDHHWEGRFGQFARGGKFGGPPHEGPKLEAPPSFYMKRQCAATFMWDPVAIDSRHHSGLSSLLWGNDYPHPEGAFPDSQEWVDKQFAGVPEHEVEQLTFGNARRIFGFDV